jgi:hypothetical protein
MRITFALTLLVLVGCGEGRPPGDLPALQPTIGKVLRNGSPVNGGELRLTMDGGPDLLINAEVTDAGTFDLTTMHPLSMRKGKGVPAGTYKATYLAPLVTNAAPMPVVALKPVTIVEGKNDVTIELPK